MFEKLQTERLSLRPIRIEDSDLIFNSWANDIVIAKYTTWQPHKNVEDTNKYIKHCLDQWGRNSFTWIVEEINTNMIVGSFAARKNDHKIDIGYLVVKDKWGQGYMTEIVKSFIAHCFQISDVRRIWAVCDVENLASKRVMEKAGMRYEGLLKSWLVNPNMGLEPRDCHCLGITRIN